MSILIGHARMDENGKVEGLTSGDQTGKEIQISTWYNRKSEGGWCVYLECIDGEMADKAASFMEEICNNNNYGYSQKNRWSGYKSIIKNGGSIEAGSGDWDCSSLVVGCYIFAGLNHKASGYTGSIEKSLLATGKFKAYHDDKHLSVADYAKRGSLYLKAGAHVLMVLEDGPLANNSTSEIVPTPETPSESDSVNRKKLSIIFGSVRVRKNPIKEEENKLSAEYKTIKIVRKGTQLDIISQDEETGWYKVETDKGIGYITNNTKYVRLI